MKGAPPGKANARVIPAERPDTSNYAAYNGISENTEIIQWNEPDDSDLYDVSKLVVEGIKLNLILP